MSKRSSHFLVPAALGLMGCGDPKMPASGPEVYVSLRADTSGATLQRSADGFKWETVCAAPCDRTVRPDRMYRVSGAGVTNSETFVLSAPTTIRAKTGASFTHATGSTLLGLGWPALIIGGLLSLGSVLGGGAHGANTEGMLAVGGGLFLAGTGMVIGGSVIRAGSGTTLDMRGSEPVAKLRLAF